MDDGLSSRWAMLTLLALFPDDLPPLGEPPASGGTPLPLLRMGLSLFRSDVTYSGLLDAYVLLRKPVRVLPFDPYPAVTELLVLSASLL